MKSPRNSKPALRRTLQCCAAALAACILAAGFASSRRTAAQSRNELAEQRVRAARARLDLANEHRKLIDEYGERYRRLVREGLLVRFDRAVAGDWFEAAINPGNSARIDGYVIGKDGVYAGADAASLSAFRVLSHRLEFTATAADEDVFAGLMDSIEKRVPGTTAQEACSVSRDRESSGDAEVLAEHCTLVWYEFAPSNTESTANASGAPPTITPLVSPASESSGDAGRLPALAARPPIGRIFFTPAERRSRHGGALASARSGEPHASRERRVVNGALWSSTRSGAVWVDGAAAGDSTGDQSAWTDRNGNVWLMNGAEGTHLLKPGQSVDRRGRVEDLLPSGAIAQR